MSFQSTLPARGATGAFQVSDALSMISIHAPRTGSDKRQREYYLAHRDFNPRSPHGERRRKPVSAELCDLYFNPRSPHGERPPGWVSVDKVLPLFQSTLPARGATCISYKNASGAIVFQSTLPARGATALRCIQLSSRRLFQSTLPARGATSPFRVLDQPCENFNPRSPHGERRAL